MNQLAGQGFIVFVIYSLTLGHVFAYETDALHGAFDQVLRQYVSNGEVDYAGIKRDRRFYAYLDILKKTNPDAFETDIEKLAFWINAYNALAIKGILDGLSPASWLGRIKFFKTADYEAGGRTITLHDLEHGIIIPFGEPRVHFAIVCASSSCPALRSGAYLAGRLSEQLEENTRRFVNNADKNRFDPENRSAAISKIFDWYRDDFRKHYGSVQRFLKDYTDDPAVASELANENFRIDYLKYDWSLNGTRPE